LRGGQCPPYPLKWLDSEQSVYKAAIQAFSAAFAGRA